jgi:hypothetical protein
MRARSRKLELARLRQITDEGSCDTLASFIEGDDTGLSCASPCGSERGFLLFTPFTQHPQLVHRDA